MKNIAELPKLANVTGRQLEILLKRTNMRSLSLAKIGKDASLSQVADLINQNRELSRIDLSEIEVNSEIAEGICNCKELSSLRMATSTFDGHNFKGLHELKNLGSLSLEISSRSKHLSILSTLPNMRRLSVELNSVDPAQWSFIADCPSLKHLTIFQGHVDDRFVVWIQANKNLRSFQVNPSSMKCFLTEPGIEQLAECTHLESLSIGGIVPPITFAKLAKMPNLKRLNIYPGLPDDSEDNSESKLKEVFRHLDSFYYRNIAGVNRSKDGVYRYVPSEGGRGELDVLEGQTLEALMGDSLSSELAAKLKGKVVVVDFWGTWCGPCIGYIPELERLHEKFSEQGLAVLGIHSKLDADSADEYLKLHPKPWANIIDYDSKLSKTFAVPVWPTIYIFGRDGKLKQAAPYRYGIDDPLLKLLNQG
jgi:thiol-disulfide isomerase/thioredoxin